MAHLISILALLVLTAVDAQGTGSNICPCLQSTPALQSVVTSSGRPATYGLNGCQAYDEGTTYYGCNIAGTAPGYCISKWCYIDQALCVVNATECQTAGGMVGDDRFAACRTLENHLTTTTSGLLYSYETCGVLTPPEPHLSPSPSPLIATSCVVLVSAPRLVSAPSSSHHCLSSYLLDIMASAIECMTLWLLP